MGIVVSLFFFSARCGVSLFSRDIERTIKTHSLSAKAASCAEKFCQSPRRNPLGPQLEDLGVF